MYPNPSVETTASIPRNGSIKRQSPVMLSGRHASLPVRLSPAWVLCAVVCLIIIFRLDTTSRPGSGRNITQDAANYEPVSISGFASMQQPYSQSCDDGLIRGELQVSQSFFLENDLVAIAGSLANHLMIDYSNLPHLSFAEQVQQTWAAIAGSSVWLQTLGVYLSVKRVFYYNRSDKYHPKISFIYAQIYDESWKHLENFTVSWQGDDIAFPRVLDIDAPWTEKGRYYGPEDPRIILEQVDGAEPIVIFNMMEDVETKNRHMYIHKPFSNFTTVLHIEGQALNRVEKNWSPLFVPRDNVGEQRGQKIWPSKHLHFVYDWHPLTVLRCHLWNGYCSFVYRDTLSSSSLAAKASEDKATHNAMHGGSNLEPLSSPVPGLASFVGFPRMKLMSPGCHKGAVYRPMLSLLTTNRSHFHVAYMSESLDLGHAVLNQTQADDICDSGRIMLVNSVARIERKSDTMTLSFTVDDSTIQIGRVRGLWTMVEALQPRLKLLTGQENAGDKLYNDDRRDVLLCSLQRAAKYAAIKVNLPNQT